MELKPAKTQVQPSVLPDDNMSKQGNTRKYLLLLLIFFILTISLLSIFLILKKEKPTESTISSGYIPFSSVEERTRFERYLDSAAKTGNKKEQFDNYYKAFTLLSIEYNSHPDSSKRDLLIKIKDFIVEKYPTYYTSLPLEIPCMEESCGVKKVYSNELMDIQEKVESSSQIPEHDKSTILLNLENAATAVGNNNPQMEYSALGVAFVNLKTVWDQNKSEDVKTIAISVLELMKKVNLVQYNNYESKGIYKLE